MPYTILLTDVAYRCCAEANFLYMNDEGAKPARDVIRLGILLPLIILYTLYMYYSYY